MENSQPAATEFTSVSKNPGKRPGKASKAKHQDAFREKKGTAELSRIHALANKRTHCDLDLEAGLELLAKLHISQSHVEAQVPCSTRAVGFVSQLVVDEAQVTAQRAVQNSGITPSQVYRVTLSQVAVQQHLASKKSVDLQDSNVAPHQPERFPLDVAQEVLSTKKTFGVLAHVVNSFGLVKQGARTMRSYVPPHPEIDIPIPCPTSSDGERRVAVPRRVVLPNPFRVTVQNLRQTVLALSDPEVPQQVRQYFRMNNPIPGAIWNNDLLVNPDDLCADNYFVSDMFRTDVDRFRRFISAAGSKLGRLFSDCRFDGTASSDMLVSAGVPTGCRISDNILLFDSDVTFRSSHELSDQQFMSGILALVGENDPQNCMSFRDPTIMTSRIDVNWSALIRDNLAKE